MATKSGNSFMAREKKIKKKKDKSLTAKMEDIREQLVDEPKVTEKENVTVDVPVTPVVEKAEEPTIKEETIEEVKTEEVKVEVEPIVEVKEEIKVETEPVVEIEEEIKTEPLVEEVAETTLPEQKIEVTEEENTAVKEDIKTEEMQEDTVETIENTVSEQVETEADIVSDEVKTEEIIIPPVINKDEEVPKAKSKKDKSKTVTKQVFVENSEENFFKLNVQQKETEGKLTSARIHTYIADKVREYASLKNYQVIDFTNKLLSIGANDLNLYGMVDISEVKLRAGGSKSLMYNNNKSVNEAISKFIDEMNEKGYVVSKNLVINLILDKMIKRFE